MKEEKCNHIPYRYTTRHFLMCCKCKKKIRKLIYEDYEAIEISHCPTLLKIPSLLTEIIKKKTLT